MPLGFSPCGIGACGHDPVLDPSRAPAVQYGAVLIDAATRDAVLLPDGSYQGVHPVDQAASLAMHITLGSAGSISSQGQTFSAIEHVGKDLDAQVQDRVRRAWSQLVARGDIEVLGVEIEHVEGGYRAQLSYRNLRLLGEESQPRTLTVSG